MIKKDKLLFPELSYKVCGLLFEVHNSLLNPLNKV